MSVPSPRDALTHAEHWLVPTGRDRARFWGWSPAGVGWVIVFSPSGTTGRWAARFERVEQTHMAFSGEAELS
jgi:hypothetical protein